MRRFEKGVLRRRFGDASTSYTQEVELYEAVDGQNVGRSGLINVEESPLE